MVPPSPWLPLPLQERLAALGGPQEAVLTRAEQLEGLLKEKQGQLSAAAKQVKRGLCEDWWWSRWVERLRGQAAGAQRGIAASDAF